MKGLLKLIPLLTFICIFLVGVIGLLIPFEFENFSYNAYPDTNQVSSTYYVSFNLENEADKTYNNTTITIKYSTKLGFSSYEKDEAIVTYTLNEGDNKITFTHSPKSGKSGIVSKIDSVILTLEDGSRFEIYTGPSIFSGINWIFCGCLIVGFFGGAISNAIFLSRKKEREFKEKDTRTFNERIRQAFTPIADTINTLKQTYTESKHNIERNSEPKPKKIVCSYCKGKYNSNEDKCPHCGAPPEPCD